MFQFFSSLGFKENFIVESDFGYYYWMFDSVMKCHQP